MPSVFAPVGTVKFLLCESFSLVDVEDRPTACLPDVAFTFDLIFCILTVHPCITMSEDDAKAVCAVQLCSVLLPPFLDESESTLPNITLINTFFMWICQYLMHNSISTRYI